MSHPEVHHEAHSHPTSQKQNRDEKPNLIIGANFQLYMDLKKVFMGVGA